MNYSGIIVTTTPDQTNGVADDLARLAGTEVHLCDERSGRLVVVLESSDNHAFEASFRRFRDLPAVVGVDLVYHFVDREPGPPSEPADTLRAAAAGDVGR